MRRGQWQGSCYQALIHALVSDPRKPTEPPEEEDIHAEVGWVRKGIGRRAKEQVMVTWINAYSCELSTLGLPAVRDDITLSLTALPPPQHYYQHSLGWYQRQDRCSHLHCLPTETRTKEVVEFLRDGGWRGGAGRKGYWWVCPQREL